MSEIQNEIEQVLAERDRKIERREADSAVRAAERRHYFVPNMQRRAARRWAENVTREEHSRFAAYCNSLERGAHEEVVNGYCDARVLGQVLAGNTLSDADLLAFWRRLLGYEIGLDDDVNHFAANAECDGWCLANGVPIEP